MHVQVDMGSSSELGAPAQQQAVSNATVMSGPCNCIVAEDALSASVPLPKIMDAVAEILQIQI